MTGHFRYCPCSRERCGGEQSGGWVVFFVKEAGMALEKRQFQQIFGYGALETLCYTDSQVEIELARVDLAEFHSFHDRFLCFKGKFCRALEMMFSTLHIYIYILYHKINIQQQI